jgi:hypothetical protein
MEIVIIIGSVIIIALSIFAAYLFVENRKKSSQIDILNASVARLYFRISEMLEQKDDDQIEKTEGFIKFLSDSRAWAFGYIEDVQKSLHNFDKRITKVIDYYSTYGSTIDGPHIQMAKQVSEAYEDLKSMLPKEDN